jgi:hypothetical protein
MVFTCGLAIMGFFLIHNYVPGFGLIWNIMHGEIVLRDGPDTCSPSSVDGLDLSGLKQVACTEKISIEYRLILAILIMLVFVVWIMERRQIRK